MVPTQKNGLKNDPSLAEIFEKNIIGLWFGLASNAIFQTNFCIGTLRKLDLIGQTGFSFRYI